MEQYKAEVQERWGGTEAYREYAEKTSNYSRQKWDDMAQGMDHIMAEFALFMKNGEGSDSNHAQHWVAQLQNYITEHYYNCTDQILASLGQMYVADERFQNNIDKHADGTAAFINEAIQAYCCK